MNAAQVATLKYWKARYPKQFAQAAQAAGVNPSGFGQTSTFSSVMDSLTGLLSSYGQYKIASDVVNSKNSANQNLVNLPGSGTATGSTNWLMYGGILLVAVVAGVLIFKKRRRRS